MDHTFEFGYWQRLTIYTSKRFGFSWEIRRSGWWFHLTFFSVYWRRNIPLAELFTPIFDSLGDMEIWDECAEVTMEKWAAVDKMYHDKIPTRKEE